MYIIYKNSRVEKFCLNSKNANKKLGSVCTRKLFQRISEITSSDSLQFMLDYRMGRCHPLQHNLEGLFAVDLEHPYRLVFEPVFDDKSNNPMELNEVIKVKILGVVNYHDGKCEWVIP